ncbi:1-acyl-sn-glycerol-3-phosphate acyltransferase [Flavihumibacter fluvii]|uniref:1-acyl-sn-glycerol-3-phosphate acyltransferase n=1 Tax=Flavihumibacter fluvii TaxID=2838157 RepID=UPI001BDDE812|nr:1-acyl-sn-glycerol-3-phosphate acyltransferase [Flavihumibacter fluvii]ULQ52322.1 1-acyl-sn-glycerol-3-phosphate acyltransferase [Flavihumibacter fluvii]
MLYRFVKIMMRAALGLFYKDILQHNLDHIPSNGAALLVANHPSSLMDAALLGILLKRPVHFFARGDIFINPIVTKILHALHMHPVHNHEAGRHTIGANDDTFEKAITLLLNGELVLFFPEGTSHIDYRLWAFRKGAFRIALQTIKRNPALQLPIVPIGINYSHPTHIFSTVWVHAGPPIITNTILQAYPGQPAMALNQITQRAFSAVQQLVVDAGKESTALLFQALDTWRNASAALNSQSKESINKELTISRAFANWPPTDRENLAMYHKLLGETGTSDAEIVAASAPKLSASPLIIGLPAAIIGWILNSLPLLLARKIADNKVKRFDFYTWILVTSAALLYISWFTLMGILAFSLLPSWKAIALMFIAFSTGQYSWNYFAYYKAWKKQLDGKKLPLSRLTELTEKRNRILATINGLS